MRLKIITVEGLAKCVLFFVIIHKNSCQESCVSGDIAQVGVSAA